MSESPLKSLLVDNTIAAARELVETIADPSGDGDALRCLACGHRCVIREGRAGTCRVRFNDGGTLRVPGGYVAGVQVDPIEKKPFYHAFPGRDALSFGMLGCDLHCGYCQNWVTSQALRDPRAVAGIHHCTPQQLADIAIARRAPVVVSTYNEPLITAEWAVEVFQHARSKGLMCGFVSNGNATPQVLDYLHPHVELYKVDLKSFDDRHYRELGGVLENVLETIARLKQMGFWVEIVTLLIPGFNDSDDELRGMAKFLADVSCDIPWHVTAYHPDYKMPDPPRTPASTLLRAYDIGRAAGLRYVYPGNLPGELGDTENTYCPQCDRLLIERHGFYVKANHMLAGGCCPDCSHALPGVWEDAPPRKSMGTGFPLPVML